MSGGALPGHQILQCESPTPSRDPTINPHGQEDPSEREDTMSPSYESGITLEDPEVRLAAEVLGEIHRSGEQSSAPAFLERVSEYPIVKTAVSAYENGKTSSKGFLYAAQTIECVARPMVRRFETLDDFACRQLDRIERRYQTNEDLESQASISKKRHVADGDGDGRPAEVTRRRSSRWQNVLTGASGLTLSLSEDSVRSLRYCIDWLHWANSHIGALLCDLRGAVVDKQNGQPRNLTEADLGLLARNIVHAKKEIAETLKKLVVIVSDYAGTALPEAARSRVRGFVLGMPGRWAARQTDQNGQYPPEKLEGTEDVGREYQSVVHLASESLEV